MTLMVVILTGMRGSLVFTMQWSITGVLENHKGLIFFVFAGLGRTQNIRVVLRIYV